MNHANQRRCLQFGPNFYTLGPKQIMKANLGGTINQEMFDSAKFDKEFKGKTPYLNAVTKNCFSEFESYTAV